MRNYLKHNYLLDFQGMVCLRVGGETLELIWFSQEMLQRKKNMFFQQIHDKSIKIGLHNGYHCTGSNY